MDDKDVFIRDHARSMSMQEMADKLGVNKSTVSRRMKALRESGELAGAEGADAKQGAQQARERLHGCAMNRADRLEALAELRDMLHAELALAGGQGLARVASEYRKTLEEMEAISAELDLASSTAKRVNLAELARFKHGIWQKYRDVDRDVLADVVDSLLVFLARGDIVEYTPLDAITSYADAFYQSDEGDE